MQGKETTELKDGDVVKLKAGSETTMHEGYEFAYPGNQGWIWFDVNDIDGAKQMWTLSLKGNEVSFENKHWSGWFLGVHDDWLCTEDGCPVWWTIEN